MSKRTLHLTLKLSDKEVIRFMSLLDSSRSLTNDRQPIINPHQVKSAWLKALEANFKSDPAQLAEALISNDSAVRGFAEKFAKKGHLP